MVRRRSSPARSGRKRERAPIVGVHELGPALVEGARILLGAVAPGVAAGNECVVLVLLRAEAGLIVIGISPRDGAAARHRRVAPILHVVLLGHAGGPGISDIIAAQEPLGLVRRVLVDEIDAP